MLKKFAIFVSLLAVITMVALSFITARFIDKEEILRVQTEINELQQNKTALEAKVKELDERQLELNKTIGSQTAEINVNKATIAKLEKSQADNQLKVRNLRTEDELERKFAETYPQLVSVKNFGITQIKDQALNLTLPFYIIPAWFAETFIIEHKNMLAYKKQIDEYKANEKLYGSILTLKDTVFRLETEKVSAYKTGYDEAYGKYEKLNADYIELLKKPPSVEFKPPSLWSALGGTALGLALGIGI
jgi:hypothetical protein